MRTIHHTVREHAQLSAALSDARTPPPTAASSGGGGGGVGQSAGTTSSTSEVTSTSTSTTFGVTRRPESLTAVQPRDPRHAGGRGGGGDRYATDAAADDERRGQTADAPRSRCLTLSDLQRSNLGDHGALTHQQLGSQSTLASDRGAGGARLLHTSHDPLHYSTQSAAAAAATAALSHHHRAGSDAPGSPIWKRRQAGRAGPSQSPASTDDGHADDHVTSAPPPPPSGVVGKQRVTFRIPPSAYIETEDTDC